MPNYDEESVQPMRGELTRVGFAELITEKDVDEFFSHKSGTALIVINSICGCAAGGARPGVSAALQNSVIPDRLGTVFAGQEKAAVRKVRETLGGHPPSSPFFALYKDGELVHAMGRNDISDKGPAEIGELLVDAFNEHCSGQGPSVDAEEYAAFSTLKVCGSTIPRTEGAPDARIKPVC
ncbi:MAG: BrxA/BrxB family bacilliredoxin [Planctomycetota bacterium]